MKKLAFTIIELIFCVVVLGILTGIAVSKLRGNYDTKGAAASLSADFTYASQHFYTKPLVSETLMSAENGFNLIDDTSLPHVYLRQIHKDFRDTNPDESTYKNISYLIYKASPFYARDNIPSEKSALRDWYEKNKFFIFPTSVSSSKQRNHSRFLKMPARLNLRKTFGVNLAVFIKHANSNKIYRISGRGSKKSSKFFLDPLTGGFLLPHKTELKGKKLPAKSPPQPLSLSAAYDFTRNADGKIIFQLRKDFIKDPVGRGVKGLIPPPEGLNKNTVDCIELNSRTHFARVIPRDKQGRQPVFEFKTDEGREIRYCHELNWAAADFKKVFFKPAS